LIPHKDFYGQQNIRDLLTYRYNLLGWVEKGNMEVPEKGGSPLLKEGTGEKEWKRKAVRKGGGGKA